MFLLKLFYQKQQNNVEKKENINLSLEMKLPFFEEKYKDELNHIYQLIISE
jgi:hypothetical protein